jgi:recombination protein RecT
MTDPAPKANAVTVIANTLRERDMQTTIKSMLPPDVSHDKFTAAVIEALKRKPEIFEEADKQSIYNAIVDAARDGLIPDGKQGALVIYNTKRMVAGKEVYLKMCQFLIMPEGIIEKLAKNGIDCYAVSVYENDHVRIWNDDTGQHVEHEPDYFHDRGQRVGAFAAARVRKSGRTFVEPMNMDEIERVKKASKQKDKDGNMTGPWRDWPERMEQKGCLHRICKRVPNVSIEEDDEYLERTGRPVIQLAPAPEPVAAVTHDQTTRPRALAAVLEQAATQTDGVPPSEPP